jgi:hypothetical protein
MKIDKPGLYFNVSEADYRADPCPSPSLTQSLAKILLAQSPRHAWMAHPRLNPGWAPDDDTKFDVGNCAHSILLGRGKEIEVLDFENWMSKDAKRLRAEALANGRSAVLLHQFERALIDWLHTGNCIVDDLKTTGMSVAPHSIGMMMANADWPLQAAFIERGLDSLFPLTAGRRTFRFVAVEDEAPHGLTVAQMGEAAMTMGRKRLQAADMLWRACVDANDWPGYVNRVVVPEYPSFRETQWLEREVNEFSEPPAIRGPMLKSLMGG